MSVFRTKSKKVPQGAKTSEPDPNMINVQICQEAKKKSEEGAWNYLVGGAENELALCRNRHAFQKWSLKPQQLKDVSQIDTSVDFLGISLKMPTMAAPIGGLTQLHPEGDFEWARGLSQSEIAGVVSGVARVEFNKIIKETTSPLMYQLYFFGDDAWVKDQLQEAESCGYKAIVLTVDTKYFGQRERDLLAGYDSRTAGWRTVPQPPDRDRNPTLELEELAKIKSYTKLPFIVKGVISEHDVLECAKLGVDAVWISNHGGRQLDCVSSSLDSLVELAPVCQEKSLPIIFDGGVRRGSELLLAYILGADVVAVGRLPVYGLIHDGAAGVKKIFDNLRTELINTMGLTGLTNLCINREEFKNYIQEESIWDLNTVWDQIERVNITES